MADTALSPLVNAVTSTRRRLTLRRKVPASIALSGAFLLLLVVLILFGGLLAPYNALAQNPLVGVSGPSGAHLLGTDQLGRDVLSLIIVGTRISLIGPACTALGTLALGATLGVLAGYRGGIVDAVVNRLADFMMALPGLLVIIVIVGVVGGGYWFAVLVLAVLGIPGEIRLCRSATSIQARLPYVDAARSLALSGSRIMFRHIVPNIAPTLIATVLLDFVFALISLAGLSYLGFGVPVGTPDWGLMLQDGQNLLAQNPWMTLAPGIIIALTAASVTVVVDWLYDSSSEDAR